MQVENRVMNWFEIPVNDISRARDFYQKILNIQMHVSHMMDTRMAFFPFDPTSGRISGALVHSEHHIPSEEGVMIYLNANPDLNEVLKKVTMQGGEVLMAKTEIDDEGGFVAYFRDTEGNRIGLHSYN
jgi:hypothetical protein